MSWIVPYARASNVLGEDEVDAVRRVFESGELSKGAESEAFGRELSDKLGLPQGVVTSSCTAALYLAAMTMGLSSDDEVLLPSQTFWVTGWPALAVGASIRFADVDERSLCATPESIERGLTERTTVVTVVHHGGNPADMPQIADLCRERGITLVEDCAHSPGAMVAGRPVGSFGDYSCFSFQSFKNMTTGEGGFLAVRDPSSRERARALGTIHVHGTRVNRTGDHVAPFARPTEFDDWHAQDAYDSAFKGAPTVGQNYRMSDINAAIGRVQLGKLDALNDRRRQIAGYLNAEIGQAHGESVTLQNLSGDRHRSVAHLYTFFLEKDCQATRDRVIGLLRKEFLVEVALRYFPIHLLPEFKGHLSSRRDLAVTESAYFKRQVQLPIYDHLSDTQVEHLARSTVSALSRVAT